MKDRIRPFLLGCLITALVFAILPEGTEEPFESIEDIEDELAEVVRDQLGGDVDEVEITGIIKDPQTQGLQLSFSIEWDSEQTTSTGLILYPFNHYYIGTTTLGKHNLPEKVKLPQENPDGRINMVLRLP